MTEDAKPTPLEPMESQGMYVATVIDLAGYKIQSGRNGVPRYQQCKHESVIYCTFERRIWCEDCNGPVDSFEAFMTLVKHLDKMLSEARADRQKAWDAKQAVIIRRAAKEMDRSWGHKMAPCCPHCKRGLLPQDFAEGAGSAVSQELEIARRKKDGANAG